MRWHNTSKRFCGNIDFCTISVNIAMPWFPWNIAKAQYLQNIFWSQNKQKNLRFSNKLKNCNELMASKKVFDDIIIAKKLRWDIDQKNFTMKQYLKNFLGLKSLEKIRLRNACKQFVITQYQQKICDVTTPIRNCNDLIPVKNNSAQYLYKILG